VTRAAPTLHFRLSDFIGDNPGLPQLEFIEAPEFEVAWIGGVGGGKTVGLCAKAIMAMLRYPGSRVILARQTYDELIKTTKQTFFRVAEPLKLAGLVEKPKNWDPKEQTNVFRLSNGAELEFSNLEDQTKFRNVEATWVGVDQAEENDVEFMMFLKSRIRQTFRQSTVPPAGRQFCLIANDEGHNWIWKRYCP
jgi:phage terminase large subunit